MADLLNHGLVLVVLIYAIKDETCITYTAV